MAKMENKIRNSKITHIIVLITILFCVQHISQAEQKKITSEKWKQGLTQEEKNLINKYNDNNYPKLVTLKTLQIEKEIFRRTNEIRNKFDQKPLQRGLLLDEIARKHSVDMVKRNFFSHINPDGKNPTGRAKDKGFRTKRFLKDREYITEISENIGKMPTGIVLYRGYVEDTPEEVAKALMKSWMVRPGHRGNILRYYSIKIGIGVTYDGKYYVATQNFF